MSVPSRCREAGPGVRRTPVAALVFLAVMIRAAAAQSSAEVAAGGLAGTLVMPGGVERPPVALIIAGSGPTDRDGTGPGVAFPYLRRLTDGLAARGIASLRYDKRGIGGSRTAALPEDRLRIDRFVDDAAIWVDWLRRRQELGPVFAVGHSEGGLIASLMVARSDVRGLVLLNSPGRRFATVLRQQLEPTLPSALRDEALATLAALERGERVTTVSPELAPLFRPSVQPYLMSLMPIDPAAILAAATVPVMMVSGGRDLQIGAADAEALLRARPDARRWHGDDMNHVLAATPGDRTENLRTYADPAAPLAAGLVEAIADFIFRYR
jgi:pimeloyl-ACP methyl ester carboxylesterase